MDTTVTWHKGMSFTGKAETGFEVPLGADPGVGGANDGFRPLELMTVSLAGCTAMDVISILTKKRQEVTSFDVKVHAELAREHPHVFTKLVVTYLVSGHNLNVLSVLRAIELSSTHYCPAQSMLSKVVPMELIYEIFEDEGNGKTKLIKRGTYQAATS